MDRVFTNIDSILEDTLKIVKLGIITKEECKDIMKQRQDFEYKLAKKASKKDDFLKYIKYELYLDRMFHERAREDGLEYDYRLRSPLRHAMILYSCAVHKFPRDESLWLSYLNLRVHRASKEGTGKVFALALQHLPRSATLWKLAAAFEFEINRNVRASRSLIQMGLQYCNDDSTLWHYFFTLELSYISILLNRISNLDSTTDEEKSSIKLDNLPEISEDDADKDRFITFGQEMFSASTLKSSSILQGKIASIVFKNSIKKIDKDFEFRKQYYKIVQTFIDSGKQSPTTRSEVERIGKLLQDEIIGSLKDDFSESDKRLWTMLAKNQLGDKTTIIDTDNADTFKSQLENTKNILNNGIDALKSDAIIIDIHKLMLKLLKRITIDNDEILSDIERFVLEKFENGEKDGILSENGYYIFVDYLTMLGMKKRAIEVSAKSTLKYSQSTMLWSQRINLLKRNLLVLNDNTTQVKLIEECFENAISKIFQQPAQQNNQQDNTTFNQSFIINYFDYKLNSSKLTFKQIIDLFKKTMRILDGRIDCQDTLKNYLIDYLFINGYQMKEIKETYQLCFQFLPISREMLLKCIYYQQESLSPDTVEIRTLYDRYFQDKNFASEDTKTWLDYRKFELEYAKNIINANLVANRARTSLRNPSDFIKALESKKVTNNK